MTGSLRRSDSEGSGSVLGNNASMQSVADGLINNPERKKQITIAGLNLGIAAACIIVFSPGLLGIELFGRSSLEAAFGWTVIFLSAVGIIYGNYRLLAEPDRPIPREEHYTDELIKHRGMNEFEDIVELTIDQIARLEKKTKNIMSVLPQIFGESEITCNKFASAIAEAKNAFFANIQIILNKLDAFDGEDYNFTRNGREAEAVLKSTAEEKLAVYSKYESSIKSAAEDNEQVLLMLDKLMLGISDLKSPESVQRGQMTEMIDDLMGQLKYYKK
jgi:hypothetical protein